MLRLRIIISALLILSLLCGCSLSDMPDADYIGGIGYTDSEGDCDTSDECDTESGTESATVGCDSESGANETSETKQSATESDDPDESENRVDSGESNESNNSATTDSQGSSVWIPTKSGTKYHSNPNCSNMKNPTLVTIDEAEKSGYTPCKKCYK